MEKDIDEDLVYRITCKLRIWLRISYWCRFSYWFLGITSVIMSALAAANEISGNAAPYFSVIAAGCLGILGFANPQKLSATYIRSYRMLDPALLRYEYSTLSQDELIKICEHADNLLNDSSLFHTEGLISSTQSNGVNATGATSTIGNTNTTFTNQS